MLLFHSLLLILRSGAQFIALLMAQLIGLLWAQPLGYQGVREKQLEKQKAVRTSEKYSSCWHL